ncbi:MAG: hypothetical protein FWC66_06410, partial [Oscillospiraceae bacterium]|nr:hypothetical protein [Oscillospiraceae bacterium]
MTTVKCKYCGKIIGDITDTCPMCGAPVPKIVPQSEKEAAPPKTKASIIVTGLVIVFAIIALVAILEMSDRESREVWRESHIAWQESHTAWQEQRMGNAPIQQIPGNAPAATGGDTLADAHRQPNEVITDPGLRQALELVFRREMRQIGWDDVHSIRT